MKSIDLSAVDLNLLVAFMAIYEERSVTAAAKRLFLGQPAMSAALGRLRVLFDDELFVRMGRTMQPTRRATAIAPEIHDIIEKIEQVLAARPTFDPTTAQREIVIGSSDYTSLVIMPRLLAFCATEAPGLDFRLLGFEKDDVGTLLEQGVIELAFGVFPEPPRQTETAALIQECMVGIARKGHPAVAAGTMSLEVFADLSHVLNTLRRDATGYGDSILAGYGLTRRIAVTTPHMVIVPSMVAATDLVAMVPSRVAEAHCNRDKFEPFELPFETEPWSISMLWSRLNNADPLNQWLRQTLTRICAEL